jgi:hypothetical protein
LLTDSWALEMDMLVLMADETADWPAAVPCPSQSTLTLGSEDSPPLSILSLTLNGPQLSMCSR